MALYSAKRHARVKGDWPLSASYSPNAISGAFSQRSPTISAGSGTVRYASSPSYSDVLTTYNYASSGDTISIPAGDATWNGQIVDTKGCLWIGAGIGQTNITSNFTPTDSYEQTGGYLIAFSPSNPSANPPFRLSGFTINFANKSYGVGFIKDQGNPIYAMTNIRIDHCNLSNPLSGDSVIHTRGHFCGVVDNCTIAGGAFMMRFFGEDGLSWSYTTFQLGSQFNFFIEDCTLSCSSDGLSEGGAGGRYCYRYNTINFPNCNFYQAFDAHGNTAVSHSATMGMELYENTINVPNCTGGGWLNSHRGGLVVAFHNNMVHPATSSIVVAYEEANDSDGPGPATSPDGEHQYPVGYYWSNTVNGTTFPTSSYIINGTVNYGAPLGNVPQWDRELFRHTTPFTGASGVGVGLLSARPTGTTEGVGYWATDTNILYRWHSGAWESYYAPYTYPHPHRSDAVLGD